MNQHNKDHLIKILKVLADIPIEDFGFHLKPERRLMGWNGHYITTGDVKDARAFIQELEHLA